MSGGLASGDPGYLTRARNAVGGLYVDAVGVHPYGQRAPDGWPNSSWGFGDMSALLDRYLAFGLPVWVTEINTDQQSIQRLRDIGGIRVMKRSDGTLVALFENRYRLARLEQDEPELTLEPLVAGAIPLY